MNNNYSNGTIELNGVAYVYHSYAAPPSKPAYIALLKVFLLDPETGHYMQSDFLRGQEIERTLVAIHDVNKHIEELAQKKVKCEGDDIQFANLNLDLAKAEKELNRLTTHLDQVKSSHTHYDIFASAYLKENEFKKDIIDQKVHDIAAKLYCKYEAELIRKLKLVPKAGNFTSNQLFNLYSKDFFKTLPKCTAETLKAKQRILKSFCEKIAAIPVSQITEKQLTEVFLDAQIAKRKRLIEDFFEFCLAKGAYAPPNPIKDYFSNHYLTEKKSKSQYSKDVKHLEKSIEARLHQLIISHLDDYEIMALILAKCACISIPEILKMSWGMLIEFNGTIIYCEKKNALTGNMQNFSRPILREGAEFIMEIRQHHLKECSEDKLNNTPIIPSKGVNDGKMKTHLTKYIRELLKQAGMCSSDISKAAPGTRDVGGAGVALLKSHYDYVLTERCGVQRNTSDWRFLHGMVSKDITDQYYRSLSDPISGIPYFTTIMRRDDTFSLSNTSSFPAPSKINGSDWQYTIPSYGVGCRSHSSIPDTFIKKGTELIISSDTFGLTGSLYFRSVDPSMQSIPQEKKELY